MIAVRSTRRTDDGAVLPLALVFTTFGAVVVVALLTFATTLIRNRPPLEERSDSFEAVQSAMNMAVTMQRSYGPAGCFPHSDGAFDVNGRSVGVACSVIERSDELGGRLGVVTTSNVGDAANDHAAISTTGGSIEVRNGVFVQGGSLAVGTDRVVTVDDAAVTASTGDTNGVSAFRYTTLDPTVPLDVATTATCIDHFGPAIDQVDAVTPFDLPTATVTFLPDVPPASAPTGDDDDDDDDAVDTSVTRVEIVPDVDSRLLGVIVVRSDGSVVLDRAVEPTGELVVSTDGVDTITELRACVQSGVAPTDPAWIPADRTWCDSPLVDPERFDQSITDGVTCGPEQWWDIAGARPTIGDAYIRPMLPQIPSFQRSTSPVQVGSSNCFVLYPGRYEGELVLDGGRQYYFASGVYLFDSPIRIADGARVVGGEGAWPGCTFDAEASFLPGGPLSAEITGKGVTFLLGDDARLDVDDASVRLNGRIATDSTRATSGISIMSVNGAVSTPELVIPSNDRVLLPGCLVSEADTNPACTADVTAYSSTPVAGGETLTYETSTLGHDDVIVDVDLNGSSATANRFLVGGAIYTPNARVELTRSAAGSDFSMHLEGGVTTTTLAVDVPSGADGRVQIGDDANAIYAKVRLDGSTSFGGQTYRASVVLEVDDLDRYAINSWVIGSGVTTP